MSAEIAATGRLPRDARTFETKTGTPMAAADIGVTVEKRGGGLTERSTIFLGLIAFGGAAAILGECRQGDTVSVMGGLGEESYTAKDGSQKTKLKVLVASIMTARTAGSRKRDKPAEPAPAPAPEQPPLDDQIPF